MDLMKYSDAAQVASTVTPAFVYTVQYSAAAGDVANTVPYLATGTLAVVDSEGTVGLAWRQPADPRIRATVGTNGAAYLAQYATNATPIPMATGVEAQLIVAEADLQAGGSNWLTTLNALRTNGTYTVTGTDTAWNAGTGGVAGLKPLTDPGSDGARVSLLFSERARWLYATGHRLGDLRRLVRQYGRDILDVYPNGVYASVTGGLPTYYGTAYVYPVPQAEQLRNGQYEGCDTLNP
jgi:hypothetical protein